MRKGIRCSLLRTCFIKKYFADFIVMNKIILKAKVIETLTNTHVNKF